MDFSWSRAQTEAYEHALAFAVDELNPLITERSGATWQPEEWQRCAQAGFVGLSIPVEYGGCGYDAQTTARTVEGFARGCVDAGLVFSICAHLFACAMAIVEFGSDDLKQRVLPRLASGEWVGANAATEAGAGSDIFAMQTRAMPSDDEDTYRLSGRKSFVSNGPRADCFLVYASTNPSHRHLGISAFVVERDRAGVVVHDPHAKLSLTSTPASSVVFDECEVPVANRVGKAGRGSGIFLASMSWERACLFAQYLGSMERQMEDVVDFAQERKQFGSPIGRFQAVAHKIVDMRSRLDSARLLLYRACWLKDQGQDAMVEISMAKLAVSEAAVQNGLDAVQIFGGEGILADRGIDAALRDALPSRIFSGTSDMQRNIIARGLGLG